MAKLLQHAQDCSLLAGAGQNSVSAVLDQARNCSFQAALGWAQQCTVGHYGQLRCKLQITQVIHVNNACLLLHLKTATEPQQSPDRRHMSWVSVMVCYAHTFMAVVTQQHATQLHAATRCARYGTKLDATCYQSVVNLADRCIVQTILFCTFCSSLL